MLHIRLLNRHMKIKKYKDELRHQPPVELVVLFCTDIGLRCKKLSI